MIRFMLLCFLISLWGVLSGSDDPTMRMCLMGGAFCSFTLLLGTLLQRAVVRR